MFIFLSFSCVLGGGIFFGGCTNQSLESSPNLPEESVEAKSSLVAFDPIGGIWGGYESSDGVVSAFNSKTGFSERRFVTGGAVSTFKIPSVRKSSDGSDMRLRAFINNDSGYGTKYVGTGDPITFDPDNTFQQNFYYIDGSKYGGNGIGWFTVGLCAYMDDWTQGDGRVLISFNDSNYGWQIYMGQGKLKGRFRTSDGGEIVREFSDISKLESGWHTMFLCMAPSANGGIVLHLDSEEVIGNTGVAGTVTAPTTGHGKIVVGAEYGKEKQASLQFKGKIKNVYISYERITEDEAKALHEAFVNDPGTHYLFQYEDNNKVFSAEYKNVYNIDFAGENYFHGIRRVEYCGADPSPFYWQQSFDEGIVTTDCTFVRDYGASGTEYCGIYLPNSALTAGKQYKWTVDVKSNGVHKIKVGHEQGGTKIVKIYDGWQRITHTFTATNNTNTAFVFYVDNTEKQSYFHKGEVFSFRNLSVQDADTAPDLALPSNLVASFEKMGDCFYTPDKYGYDWTNTQRWVYQGGQNPGFSETLTNGYQNLDYVHNNNAFFVFDSVYLKSGTASKFTMAVIDHSNQLILWKDEFDFGTGKTLFMGDEVIYNYASSGSSLSNVKFSIFTGTFGEDIGETLDLIDGDDNLNNTISYVYNGYYYKRYVKVTNGEEDVVVYPFYNILDAGDNVVCKFKFADGLTDGTLSDSVYVEETRDDFSYDVEWLGNSYDFYYKTAKTYSQTINSNLPTYIGNQDRRRSDFDSSNDGITSVNGVNYSICPKLEQSFKISNISCPDGYVCTGFYTSDGRSYTADGEYLGGEIDFYDLESLTIYACFAKLSDNNLKYDPIDKYFYFEDGVFPQSAVVTLENGIALEQKLNSEIVSTSEIDGLGAVKFVTLNGFKYMGVILVADDGDSTTTATKTVKLRNNDSTSDTYLEYLDYTFSEGVYYWFRFDPIRWRVSDYGVSEDELPADWANLAQGQSNVEVVSDVLWYDALNDSDNALGVGDSAMQTTLNQKLIGNTFITGKEVENIAGLPDEYQQVEYLKNNYTGDYINTGIKATQNTVFEIDTVSEDDYSVFGADGIGENMFNLTGNSTRSFRWGTQMWNGSGYSCQERMLISFGQKIYINGNLVKEFNAETFTTDEVYLFRRKNDGADQRISSIYSLKVYESDELIRHFVPCIRKSDGLKGLYDLVQGRFYTNANYGMFASSSQDKSFRAGTPVESTEDLPEDYRQVEYVTIRNFDTPSYINNIVLDLSLSQTSKVEMTVSSTDTGSYVALMCTLSKNQYLSPGIYIETSDGLTAKGFASATLLSESITRAEFSDGTIRTISYEYSTTVDKKIVFGSASITSHSRTINWYSMRLYGLDGVTLVADLVPCVRMFGNLAGFYDVVNQKFYYNTSFDNYLEFEYAEERPTINVDTWANSNTNEKVSTEQKTQVTTLSEFRIANLEEISAYQNDLKSYASQLVCAITGKDQDQYFEYWTRDFGQQIGTGTYVTRSGIVNENTYYTRKKGVRFAYNMSEGSNTGDFTDGTIDLLANNQYWITKDNYGGYVYRIYINVADEPNSTKGSALFQPGGVFHLEVTLSTWDNFATVNVNASPVTSGERFFEGNVFGNKFILDYKIHADASNIQALGTRSYIEIGFNTNSFNDTPEVWENLTCTIHKFTYTPPN